MTIVDMESPFSDFQCLEYNECNEQIEHDCLKRGHGDHLFKMAGELRIEHRSSDLESGVLPLNDSPVYNFKIGGRLSGYQGAEVI